LLGKNETVPSMPGMKVQLSIDDLFDLLNFMRQHKKSSMKMDGLIHNFQDFAEQGWTSLFENEGPKTIEQIEQDYYDKLDEFNRNGKVEQKVKRGKKRKQSYYDDDESSQYSDDNEEEEKIDDVDLFGGPNRKGDKNATKGKSKQKLSSSIAKERIQKIWDITKLNTDDAREKA